MKTIESLLGNVRSLEHLGVLKFEGRGEIGEFQTSSQSELCDIYHVSLTAVLAKAS